MKYNFLLLFFFKNGFCAGDGCGEGGEEATVMRSNPLSARYVPDDEITIDAAAATPLAPSGRISAQPVGNTSLHLEEKKGLCRSVFNFLSSVILCCMEGDCRTNAPLKR